MLLSIVRIFLIFALALGLTNAFANPNQTLTKKTLICESNIANVAYCPYSSDDSTLIYIAKGIVQLTGNPNPNPECEMNPNDPSCDSSSSVIPTVDFTFIYPNDSYIIKKRVNIGPSPFGLSYQVETKQPDSLEYNLLTKLREGEELLANAKKRYSFKAAANGSLLNEFGQTPPQVAGDDRLSGDLGCYTATDYTERAFVYAGEERNCAQNINTMFRNIAKQSESEILRLPKWLKEVEVDLSVLKFSVSNSLMPIRFPINFADGSTLTFVITPSGDIHIAPSIQIDKNASFDSTGLTIAQAEEDAAANKSRQNMNGPDLGNYIHMMGMQSQCNWNVSHYNNTVTYSVEVVNGKVIITVHDVNSTAVYFVECLG